MLIYHDPPLWDFFLVYFTAEKLSLVKGEKKLWLSFDHWNFSTSFLVYFEIFFDHENIEYKDHKK